MHEDIGPVDAQIPQATYLAMMPDGSVVQETLMLDNSGSMEDQIKREVEMNPQLYDNTIFELPNGLMHVQDGQNVLMRGDQHGVFPSLLDVMADPSIQAMLKESTTKPVPKVMDQEALPANFGPVLLQDDEPTPVPEMMAPIAEMTAPVAAIPSMGPEDFGSFASGFDRPENRGFDPQGSGYDYNTAMLYGMAPDESGHYFSRVPQTGLLLKGANHPTFPKTLAAEAAMGNTVTQGPDGRYYSN